MKGGRRTAKGRIINIDDVIASAPHTTAVGNMSVNAQGDKLGKGGEVTATREQRTRAYYKNHPQASNQKVSLKGEMKEAMADVPMTNMAPKTTQTAKENVRTEDLQNTSSATSDDYQAPQTEVTEPVAPEPTEFDDVEMPPEGFVDQGEIVPEPDGYEEVQLPNGDIEMRPYWNDDNDNG